MKFYKIMINVKFWTSKLNFGDFVYSLLMLHFFHFLFSVRGYSWAVFIFLADLCDGNKIYYYMLAYI